MQHRAFRVWQLSILIANASEYQQKLKLLYLPSLILDGCDSLALLRPLDAISSLIQVMFAVLIRYILIYILLIPYDALYRKLIPPAAAILFGIGTAGIVSIASDYFRVGAFESFCITLWVIRLALHELI